MGPRNQENDRLVQYPTLVVEVLSPSTEAFDRGSKFAQYRQINSLQEYPLIQSEQAGVECFRRNEAGLWVLYPDQMSDNLHLASLDFSLPVATLYRRVEFEPAKASA